MWACIHIDAYTHIIETAELKSEEKRAVPLHPLTAVLFYNSYPSFYLSISQEMFKKIPLKVRQKPIIWQEGGKRT
jgi:hypothetical protein